MLQQDVIILIREPYKFDAYDQNLSLQFVQTVSERLGRHVTGGSHSIIALLNQLGRYVWISSRLRCIHRKNTGRSPAGCGGQIDFIAAVECP